MQKITNISFEQFADDDFKPPCLYYIKTCFDYVFIHGRKRDIAQQWVNNEYGKGKYTVRVSRIE